MQLKRISILSSTALLAISLFSCGGNQTQNDTGTDTTKVIKDSAEDAKQTETIDVAALSKEQGVSVSGRTGNYTYVDLGLKSGAKWATYNVGAGKPTEYGDHFAWGETSPKKKYDWSSYKWCKGSENTLTKYCVDSTYGAIDGLVTLLAEDDAATANWGVKWRMPTQTEQQELIDGCSWKWTDNFNGSGNAGRVGTSKANGNTIFLPAAGYSTISKLNFAGGYGGYWSSSLYVPSSLYERFIGNVYTLCFDPGEEIGFAEIDESRYVGHSVRAVVK